MGATLFCDKQESIVKKINKQDRASLEVFGGGYRWVLSTVREGSLDDGYTINSQSIRELISCAGTNILVLSSDNNFELWDQYEAEEAKIENSILEGKAFVIGVAENSTRSSEYVYLVGVFS